MKKLISIITVFCLTSGLFMPVSSARLCGDINGDGEINSLDIISMIIHLNGSKKLTGEDFNIANTYTYDETFAKVDSQDLVALIQYVFKQIKALPVDSEPVTTTRATTTTTTTTTTARTTTTAKTTDPRLTDEYEREVLRLFNIERAANDVPPLEWHDGVAAVARAHSNDMAERGFYAHVNPEGFDSYDRVKNAELQFGKQWSVIENIAAGSATPEIVVKEWMNSEAHRNAILNPQHSYVGIGRCGNLWTADFVFIIRS